MSFYLIYIITNLPSFPQLFDDILALQLVNFLLLNDLLQSTVHQLQTPLIFLTSAPLPTSNFGKLYLDLHIVKIENIQIIDCSHS